MGQDGFENTTRTGTSLAGKSLSGPVWVPAVPEVLLQPRHLTHGSVRVRHGPCCSGDSRVRDSSGRENTLPISVAHLNSSVFLLLIQSSKQSCGCVQGTVWASFMRKCHHRKEWPSGKLQLNGRTQEPGSLENHSMLEQETGLRDRAGQPFIDRDSRAQGRDMPCYLQSLRDGAQPCPSLHWPSPARFSPPDSLCPK